MALRAARFGKALKGGGGRGSRVARARGVSRGCEITSAPSLALETARSVRLRCRIRPTRGVKRTPRVHLAPHVAGPSRWVGGRGDFWRASAERCGGGEVRHREKPRAARATKNPALPPPQGLLRWGDEEHLAFARAWLFTAAPPLLWQEDVHERPEPSGDPRPGEHVLRLRPGEREGPAHPQARARRCRSGRVARRGLPPGLPGRPRGRHLRHAARLPLQLDRGLHADQAGRREQPPVTVTADYAVTLRRPTPMDGPITLTARATEVKDDRSWSRRSSRPAGRSARPVRGRSSQ